MKKRWITGWPKSHY